MKFTSLLKKVILENTEKIEFLIDTYAKPKKKEDGTVKKPKLTIRELAALVAADPTSRLNNIDISTANPKELANAKAGKYTQWLIKSYLNTNQRTEIPFGQYGYDQEVKQLKDRFMEDLYKVTDDLKKFDRFKGKLPLEKRQIQKITPDELYDLVKDFDLTLATTTKAERKSAPVHPGAKLAYEGDEWRIIEIKDKGAAGKEAACFYGGNQQETRWCTSAPGLSWFDRYIKDGPLYVIYRKDDPKVSAMTGLPVERYQFHFESNQFMDKDDRQQDLIKLLNGPMAELKDYFKPQFAKSLTVGGEKLEINSFSSGPIGKFIALYGLEELIESLPETLEEFMIKNKEGDNNIIISIPPSISRFKKLSVLLLSNCIESVPDSICELKELNFISFLHNPKLKTIPACIANLPNLVFLNLKGSDNVNVPKEIQKKSTNIGGGMWDFQP